MAKDRIDKIQLFDIDTLAALKKKKNERNFKSHFDLIGIICII